MDLQAQYDPKQTETKWYDYWMKHDLFRSVPDDREAYTIVIPPPNVTGVLHMGHMLNNSIQDILVRRARMQGKNACWVPGTDHASIATEAKVVAKLQSEGIDKDSLTRNQFMEHAWEWKEKHGGIILDQLKKLGASCDWERTKFTMDDDMSESVIQVFIDLYNKGLIYRGVRMINWDPAAQTALSDEEVIHTEENSKLYYLRYAVENADDQWVTIATTRPETILGDTAVCIHPDDERYAHLKGKRVIVPLINRSVPIIEDEYVDREFGTGCLKITPAHDIHDYELGMKHQLESIDIFHDNGTLNDAAQLYVGQDRFEVRTLITKELNEKGFLIKEEEYQNKVGRSERTNAIIEPKLSLQWFLKMEDLAKPALDVVMSDDVQLYPPKFKNTYRHWMENVRDWCVSRQLWWGQRIPAYYLPNSNDFVVADTPEKAVELARQKTGNMQLQASDLRQDEDVLDTWFSSWLWPISVFDGIRQPNNPEINYYYPTNDLVTAPEILFFWVARMIIAGQEYQNAKPFKNVYLTGIVRDKQGRKMSKSLGNSPDPIDLMKIYGADGVRVGMLFCSPAGGDLLYDNKLPEQGRNFSNKIWNAFRLINQWEIDKEIAQPEASRLAIEWFDVKFNAMLLTINQQFDDYRISDALMTIYRFFWDDWSSWFLEIIKPEYQKPIDHATYQSTITYLDNVLRVLHPFMPFITEEIWQLIADRKDGESIIISKMPTPKEQNNALANQFEIAQEAITAIRKVRKDKNISFKEKISLLIRPDKAEHNAYYDRVLMKMGALEEIKIVDGKINGAMSFIIKGVEYYIPLGNLVDTEEEIAKLQKELSYAKGFLKSVQKKMSNERFIQNAPPKVIEMETQKRVDAEAKIKALEEQIDNMKNA